MLKITNPRLGLSSPYPVASEIAYDGTQTGLPDNVQDAITQLDTNINIISNDYETKEVFNDISGKTNGTITTYANLSIMQEEWANEDNAIAVEISQGKPTENFLFTSQGEVVKATIDTYGNYTLDGIPTATDYAICYLLRGTKSAFGLAEIPQENIISEYDFDSPFVVNGTDIEPINLSYNLNLKNGGLKDTFVSTAIKLGDALNTSFSTANKTIVGAINEILALKVNTSGDNAVFDNLNNTAKQNITNLFYPDLTAGVSVSSGSYTPTSNGWFKLNLTGANSNGTITDTSTSILLGEVTGGSSQWYATAFLIPVQKSKEYTVVKSGTNISITFFPNLSSN